MKPEITDSEHWSSLNVFLRERRPDNDSEVARHAETYSMCFLCLKDMRAGNQQATPIKGGIQNGTR
ncbi:hypothetical protein GXP75_15665 [Bacillus sp. HU-1818]|uniref:hypothetical protein n=1 Tax=Bacillus sp. HU-1818 TaxID=2704469 RepID=UPI001F5E0157|nr:hypothetical protein [Bacillus sp. HU-1818]MCI3197071.1 hypothetical protein [Bacillus sp. HU-1818]